jgi:hypothetical protein
MRPGEILSLTVTLPNEPRIEIPHSRGAVVERAGNSCPRHPPDDQIIPIAQSSILFRVHAPRTHQTGRPSGIIMVLPTVPKPKSTTYV